jgi:hypothetical protein
VTAILRRLQEFGGVYTPSIVRDSKVWASSPSGSKNFGIFGLGGRQGVVGWGPFPSLPPPPPTQTTRRSLVLGEEEEEEEGVGA